LDTKVDWIPGLKNIRLKDLPDLIKVKDPNHLMLKYTNEVTDECERASAIV